MLTFKTFAKSLEMTQDSHVTNELGIFTLSLGNFTKHKLEPRLHAAAKAGFTVIDLFDDDWGCYLGDHGLDPEKLWEPTAENLAVATKLGNLIKELGMRVVCVQPLRGIEGIKDPQERKQQLGQVAKRFPFMRALQTNMTFICSQIRVDDGITIDLDTCAKDLYEIGEMAANYVKEHGGEKIFIGYEGLSWAQRNTWKSTWEVVAKVNHPNIGIILDAFNILAVEYADPYNPKGHGRRYDSEEEAISRLEASMTELVNTVPVEKILFVQLGDANLVDPAVFLPPAASEGIPRLLPWSRNHRLFPMEQSLGGYMPVELVVAAILATGYKGPLGLEVFNSSLFDEDPSVPATHATRAFVGLTSLFNVVEKVRPFWK